MVKKRSETKCLSLSETISSGKPKPRKNQLVYTKEAHSSAERVFLVGTATKNFDNRSVITKRKSNPSLDFGRVAKSIPTLEQMSPGIFMGAINQVINNCDLYFSDIRHMEQ